ncbi:hypothetical protein N7470_000435 [Penicillium chermesinum]|nr:hypothetical protein N7470_000435 [Penicillium chermesinum]
MSGPYDYRQAPPYAGSPAQQYQPYQTPPPGASAYNRAPPQQPSYPASPGGYARPPPPPPQGYPPQGSPYPGGPPGPGPSAGPPGGQYGPPGGVSTHLIVWTVLVQSLAHDAPSRLNKLIHEWNVPMEVATDVMKLALFDVVLYVDDSGSIEFEENGLRKDQLKQILGIVATAASTFDQDGISVRFMNNAENGDGIRTVADVQNLVSRVRFAGLTPLGTSLRNKVVEPLVVGPARAGRLEKPVLVITITDGQPAGEPHSMVADTIRYAVDEVSRTRYGRGAVSFQFSQVGNDTRARKFLSDLDEDPQIGSLIDCTSNFEVEQDEMSRAVPPVHLTRELWCAKLMLGAIDSSYDTKDEKAQGRANGGGAPPPQGYGGYSHPPGGPPSGPPPGGPQGYGGPPSSGPPQGYGRPAPAGGPPGGYQQGYGAQPSYGPGPGQGGYSPQPPQQGYAPPPGPPPGQHAPYGGAQRDSPYGQQPYGYPPPGPGYPPSRHY